MNGRDLDFKRRKQLYFAYMSNWLGDTHQENLSLMMLQEREHMLTHRDKKKALEGKGLVRVVGYLSESEAISMVRQGSTKEILHKVKKVKEYFDIYDTPIPAIHGENAKMKTVARYRVDEDVKVQRKDQMFVSDVMHIDGNQVLIVVSSLLELTINSNLKGLTKEDLGITM